MTTGMEGDVGRSMDGGSQQGERLQGAASGLMDQAARTAQAQASTTMTKVGETLDQVAKAIRDAGNSLNDSQPEIARFADTAAARVSDAASYLREHDAREVVDNAQRIARERPAVVVGGALALGLLLGRFLRSGAEAAQSSGSMQPAAGPGAGSGRVAYGSGAYSGAGAGSGAGPAMAGSREGMSSGYGSSPTGYEAGAGAGAAIAATDTVDDLTTGPLTTGATGVGSELGGDVGLGEELPAGADVEVDVVEETGFEPGRRG